MTETEIKCLLDKQRTYYRSGVTIPTAFRVKQLKKLYAAVKQYETQIAAALREAAPDVVFVCTGFPKQERFMAAHTAELPHCLMLGLGGSLDAFAGEVTRAPAFFRNHGLEWFYRLLREPKRIGRMMKLPVFLWLALCERMKQRRKGA